MQTSNTQNLLLFLDRYAFRIFSAIFIAVSLAILPDFGINVDSVKNFDEGRINLSAILHFSITNTDQMFLSHQIHGSLFFMLCEVSRIVFSEWIPFLNPISARHLPLPFLFCFFANNFYAFLKKRVSHSVAFLAGTILLTIPPVFGHIFQNIKDIPLIVFFSFTLIYFLKWTETNFAKNRYLLIASLCLGLTFCIKLYAALIFPLLLLYLIFLHNSKQETSIVFKNIKSKKNIFLLSLCAIFVIAFTAIFYMPAIWTVEQKLALLSINKFQAAQLLGYGTKGFQITPFLRLFLILPSLSLLFGIWGLIKTAAQPKKNLWSTLSLVWFFVVLLTACMPIFPVYNGIRLYMVFIVPFCFFIAAGIIDAARRLEKFFPKRKFFLTPILGTMVIGCNIWGIVETHPYEFTFFNALSGGLKGVQEKRLEGASDYWLASFREGVMWINKNAANNSTLYLSNLDGEITASVYPRRKDISIRHATERPFNKNSYLFLPDGLSVWINAKGVAKERVFSELLNMKKVHRIERQGGKILEIYRKD